MLFRSRRAEVMLLSRICVCACVLSCHPPSSFLSTVHRWDLNGIEGGWGRFFLFFFPVCV